LKNEVKKKMMSNSRKSRHQSHPERKLMTKVNQNLALNLSRIEIAKQKNGSFTPMQVLVAKKTSCD